MIYGADIITQPCSGEYKEQIYNSRRSDYGTTHGITSAVGYYENTVQQKKDSTVKTKK